MCGGRALCRRRRRRRLAGDGAGGPDGAPHARRAVRRRTADSPNPNPQRVAAHAGGRARRHRCAARVARLESARRHRRGSHRGAARGVGTAPATMRPRGGPARRARRVEQGPPLLALLALLAVTRAPSASADVAGAPGSLGASEARGAARAIFSARRGDAAARVARVTATPGEPFASAQAVEVRGFSRLTQPHKAFHHVSLEVFDDARSSFARNECELRLADGRRVKTRADADRGRGNEMRTRLTLAKANFVANEGPSVASAAADDRTTRMTRSTPTLVADFGPLRPPRRGVLVRAFLPLRDSIVRTNVRVDDAFTVTFEVVGNDRDVTTRRWRFILGRPFAPRLADVAAAHVSGAILGVAALALFFAAKAARIVAGGRAARAGAGVVAAVSAFVVPPRARHESSRHVHQSVARRAGRGSSSPPARSAFRFLEIFRLRRRACRGARTRTRRTRGALEAVTLAYALAGTALTLAGAGAGSGRQTRGSSTKARARWRRRRRAFARARRARSERRSCSSAPRTRRSGARSPRSRSSRRSRRAREAGLSRVAPLVFH